MQCDICYLPASHQRKLNCELCAQAAVYQSRLHLAQSLLKNESLEKEVEQGIFGTINFKKSAAGKDVQKLSPAWAAERATAEQATSIETMDEISSHVKVLREEIQYAKLDIAKRKARLARRRKEMAAAKEESFQTQSNVKERFDKDIERVLQKGEGLHQEIVGQRLAHCTQIARLFSLQQYKRRRGNGKDIYSIGFTSIPDLRELNSTSLTLIAKMLPNAILDIPPIQITTSLIHIANLVHLISHHLSLKLPAQIILPQSEYPLPTILSPNVSYTTSHLSYPGSTPSQSSHNSPTASRLIDRRTQPRARPLFLKKKLSSLAKDDPLAYAHFVEGMTLLAWDIAWLCKTQGIDVGGNSWDDVCPMGKNLWQLLFSPPTRPPLSREISKENALQRSSLLSTHAKGTHSANPTSNGAPPPPGFFSHGTAHGFLAAATGNEYMGDWKLQNPVKVIDKVKAMLLADRTGAEWEILEGNEWEGADAEANTVNGEQIGELARIEETGILVKPEDDVSMGKEVERSEREDERGKGASGWTKLKTR